MTTIRKLIIPLALLAMPVVACAADIVFSHDYSGRTPNGYGIGRIDTYDVCVRISEPALKGKTMTRITVPLADNGKGSLDPGAAVWVSASLPAEGVVPGPDNTLLYVEAEPQHGLLDVSLPVPLTVPDGEIYVGYTLTVTELVNYTQTFPLATVPGETPGALYVRTRERRPAWIDAPDRLGRVSPMTVTFSGDFPEVAASPSISVNPYAGVGKEMLFPVMVSNHGLEPVSSLDYEYQAGDRSGKGTLTLDDPIPARFGMAQEIGFSAVAGSETGEVPFRLVITGVNGRPNADPVQSAEGTMNTLPFLPVNRPLVEEYTGLWCGACPAGWVALEQGRHYYGDDFIAIAFHSNDPMQTYKRFPMSINHYPTIHINRNPESGANETLADWELERRKLAPASLDVDIAWAGDDHREITARATARFLEDHKGEDIRFAFALVADGLHSTSWRQNNNFVGQTIPGLYWDIFTKGQTTDLPFNDVMLIFDEPLGIERSLPSDISALEEYSASYSFTLANAVNRSGQNVIQDEGMLRVVAILVDADTNTVINAARSGYSSDASVAAIGNPVSAADVVATEWYSLSGLRLDRRPEGYAAPCVRLDRLSDGSVRVRKVMLRQ